VRVFRTELAAAQAAAGVTSQNRAGRRWFYVPYDQLSDQFEVWQVVEPNALGFVFIESPAKAARRPYHKQKLAMVLANQRHFALEQARRGVAVEYLVSATGYEAALSTWLEQSGLASVSMQEAAERELRTELFPLIESGGVEVLPHGGWLTSVQQFAQACPKQPYRMDTFYRRVRRDSGWLMESGKPLGGKWSFDAENRKPWKGEPIAPMPPTFPMDPIKQEVLDLVAKDFAAHPGKLRPEHLPATRADAQVAWNWALSECLEHFGPYEDAMSEASTGLFHTRVSPLLNLHRLMPRKLVEEVLRSEAPLASREGFLRQVAGWREFVRHVHRETDGFVGLVRESNYSLPPVYWGGASSGMRCLDGVVQTVWDEAYSHHITRLMVLGNIATLLEADARELSDWFWVAYADAYDWVVEPNVLGMATWATAGVMTTKPYISGAAYINRMGDSCKECAFHPGKSCPITPLYWAWLGRHRDELAGNARMAMPLKALEKRTVEQQLRDKQVFEHVQSRLAAGLSLSPPEQQEELPFSM